MHIDLDELLEQQVAFHRADAKSYEGWWEEAFKRSGGGAFGAACRRDRQRVLAELARLAMISDIHANLVALDAVLADALSIGVDAYWILGDLVAIGPEPVAVLERLASLIGPSAALGRAGERRAVSQPDD